MSPAYAADGAGAAISGDTFMIRSLFATLSHAASLGAALFPTRTGMRHALAAIAILAAAFITIPADPVRADDRTLDQMTPEEVDAELNGMNWQYGPGEFVLPVSQSRIVINENQEILLGEEAARYDYLTGGVPAPETEALVWNYDDESMTYFTYYAVGYVTEEDWEHVDPADFMAQIKEYESELNDARQSVGIDPFFTNGWRQEPVFNAAQHTAYWATDLSSATDRWINATALRLSRGGYHQVIWAGGGDGFTAAESTLAGLLDTHNYDPGHRYEDYVDGDPEADLSIGELAAATMGVDLGAGAIAVLIGSALVLLKKGWIVIIPIVAGIGALMRRRKRQQAATTATGTSIDTPPPPAVGS